jgi:hypothetical protein
MIIKSHRRITSVPPVAPKQPKPQPKVEKKPEKKEEIKKVSFQEKENKQSIVFDDLLIQDEEIIIPEEE